MTPPPTLRKIPHDLVALFDAALGYSRADIERLFNDAVRHVSQTWKLDDIETALTSKGHLENFFLNEGNEGLQGFREIFREVWEGKKVASAQRDPSTAPLVETYIGATDAAVMSSPIPDTWWSRPRVTAEAVQWSMGQSAQKLTAATEELKDGVRDIVSFAFETEGRGKAGIKRALLALDGKNGNVLFGLASRGPNSTEALNNWIEKEVTAKGIKGVKAQKKIAHRFGQLRRRRAKLVAQTESVEAANEGQDATYRRAVVDGQIDPEIYILEWVARSIRCKRCNAFDGATRALTGGLFVSDGTGPKGVERIRLPDCHPGGWCFVRSIRRSEALRQPDP